jgi:hypothetical protein
MSRKARKAQSNWHPGPDGIPYPEGSVEDDLKVIEKHTKGEIDLGTSWIEDFLLERHYDCRPAPHRAAMRRALHAKAHGSTASGSTVFSAALALTIALVGPPMLAGLVEGARRAAVGRVPGVVHLTPLIGDALTWLCIILVLALPPALLVIAHLKHRHGVVHANAVAMLLDDREAFIVDRGGPSA